MICFRQFKLTLGRSGYGCIIRQSMQYCIVVKVVMDLLLVSYFTVVLGDCIEL